MAELTVSALAKRVGVRPDTVRYYERAGLLPAPARTPGGYRLYDERAVERLRFIRGAQRVGLRLRDIAELLQIADRGSCPCGHSEDLVRRRLAELDAEIARLTETRRQLSALSDCSTGACGALPWPCADDTGGEVTGDGPGLPVLPRLPLLTADC